MDGLISFWDFQTPERGGYRAKGQGEYVLRPRPDFPPEVEDGIFGPRSIRLSPGVWLECPRIQCPLLNIHGPDCEVSVVAWIRWRTVGHCQFIAGMWDETNRARQYGLFLNLNRRYNSHGNVHGHVSADGGPTEGNSVCLTYATGASELLTDRWYMVAMTYDGREAKAFVDGTLDENPVCDPLLGQLNPLTYTKGLFNGGLQGADFTVGSVFSGRRMNNWFDGDIGGLAVFNRALDSSEQVRLKPALLPLAG